MSEDSFKSIRNGVIASVIAGIVLLVVPVLRNYVISFFSWMWSIVVWCGDALISSYALPGLAWLPILIFATIGLVNIYSAIKGEAEEPDYQSYVEDFIYGVMWRWDWPGNHISNLWCYCTSCDATLIYDDSTCRNLYSNEKKTDFICENCGHTVVATISGGNKSYAISAVEREIDRRVRTGEYKKH